MMEESLMFGQWFIGIIRFVCIEWPAMENIRIQD